MRDDADTSGGSSGSEGIGPAWTGLLVAAAVMRLIGINAEGFWFDEVMQVVRASDSTFTGLWSRIPADKPPLAFYTLWPLARVSLAESWLRLPSLLAGIASVGMIGLLARSAVSRSLGGLGSAAVIAALVLAVVSPLSVKLSREVLPYSAATAWVCLAYLAALWARASPQATRNGGAILLVATATALAVWTSYQAVAALVPLGLVALAWALHEPAGGNGRDGRRTALSIAAAVLLGALSAAPLLVRLLANPLPETQWAAGPFWTDSLPLVLGGLSAGFDGAPSNPIWAAFSVLVAIGAFSAWTSQPRNDAAVALLAWLGLGLALLVGSGYAQEHWIAVRYLLFFVPPWLVLCALGAAQAAHWLRGDDVRARWIVAGCTAVLVIFSLPTLVATHSSRPDHRGLAIAIAARAQPGDMVVFQNRLDEVPYLHYRRILSSTAPSSVSVQLGDRENPALGERLRSASRVWVPELVYHWTPMRGEVRAFFLPADRESIRRGEVPLRSVSPEAAAAALLSGNAGRGGP